MSRTVLCYGDSNTYGYDPRSFLGDRYAKDIRWTGILDGTSDWSVTCCGQNGREIPTQPRQWEEVRELLRQAGPDVFAVMLGSNFLTPFFFAHSLAPVSVPHCTVLSVGSSAVLSQFQRSDRLARHRRSAAALRVLCRKCHQPLFEIGVVGLHLDHTAILVKIDHRCLLLFGKPCSHKTS